MKLLIVTTSKYTLRWKKLSSYIKQIKSALNKTPNATWEVEIVYRDIVPEVENGRITHEWFNQLSYPLFRQGNQFIVLHMSQRQKNEWGIKPSLRGSNQVDRDFVGESYIWSDQFTKRDGEIQFIQTTLHEMSHELARSTGTPDETHPYHRENPDIKDIFYRYDMAKWQPVYTQGMKVVENLKAKIKSLLLRSSPKFFLREYPVSQGYGVENRAWYKQTGHHIGVDLATPVGTPIIAPELCLVSDSGFSNELGYWCEVKVNKKYYYFMHLKSKVHLGGRNKNWVIGFTGNTGFSTNPHCHIEIWDRKRDVSILSPTNFDLYTEAYRQ